MIMMTIKGNNKDAKERESSGMKIPCPTAQTVDWICKAGLTKALSYLFELGQYIDKAFPEQVLMLCKQFKPGDTKPLHLVTLLKVR